MSKTFTVERKIIFLLAVVIILVIVMGGVAYRNMTGIIDSVDAELRPDDRLVVMKEMMTDLTEAENAVKSFTLTQDSDYLVEFYSAVDRTGERIIYLQNLHYHDSALNAEIDTIDELVGIKFLGLEHLLENNDKAEVQAAFDRFSKSLENNSKNDSSGSNSKNVETLWQRIFGKKATDDTIEAAIPVQKINKKINEARAEELERIQARRERELSLIQADKEIMAQLRSSFDKLERAELEEQRRFADIAEEKAREANYYIGAFCVLAGGLLLMATITIVKFVRNNNRYKKAMLRAKRQAENLAETKEKFLANMSHEIRTPMNSIAGFTEQLYDSELNPDQKEKLRMVKQSTDHLLRIVNDVLDFAKLDAGKLKLQPEPFRMVDVLESLESMTGQIARKKKLKLNHELQNEIPPVLVGDVFRLKQILINLVGNAIKFTTRGSVLIRVSKVQQENGTLVLKFTVRDTGVGMSPEELNAVFREFEQAQAGLSQKEGGTGLGMSITKKLVELFEGDISIESESGLGTTVSVILPFEIGDESMLSHESKSKAEIPQGEFSILIADDEPFNRKLLISILTKHNLKFKEAANGKEVLDLLNKERFDLLLLDMRMPVMDGLKTADYIRAGEVNHPQLPIIALTAATRPEDLKSYEDHGLDGFVPKPFRESQLIEEMAKHLNVKKIYDSEPMPLYNLHGLQEMANHQQDFVNEMIETFFTTMDESFAEMEEAFKNEEMVAVADGAHRLAGPARMMEMESLHPKLSILEEEARSKRPNPAKVDQYIKELKDEAIEVRESLKSYLDANSLADR